MTSNTNIANLTNSNNNTNNNDLLINNQNNRNKSPSAFVANRSNYDER